MIEVQFRGSLLKQNKEGSVRRGVTRGQETGELVPVGGRGPGVGFGLASGSVAGDRGE